MMRSKTKYDNNVYEFGPKEPKSILVKLLPFKPLIVNFVGFNKHPKKPVNNDLLIYEGRESYFADKQTEYQLTIDVIGRKIVNVTDFYNR